MSIKRLEVVYVVASRYDDDGYAYRWFRGVVPSNTLACLRGLTLDIAKDDPIEDVEIRVETYDDTVQRIPISRIIRRNRREDTRVVVGIVGVQSNQFERATDLALQLREGGVSVMIGGFHVSGMLALFDEPSPDLQVLLDAGVSLVQGEAESPGVLKGILEDALHDRMRGVYRLPPQPDIADAPLPEFDHELLDRYGVRWGTVDTSRGCPFGCTFCTIINVQGRKMRCRSAEAVVDSIRRNWDRGVRSYFFTDDNFSRNRNWREVLDGLIEMREKEGKGIQFMMQVDTQAYKIPDLVEKATEAGCRMVFVGMESVNPESLKAAGKVQNDISDYRNMVQAWRDASILVHVGYIIGFPTDSEESVRSDVAFLRDHVGVDQVSFFMLTPLPGSEDHRNMVLNNVPISKDLNLYDSFHETFDHPQMGPGRWRAATEQAYADFYEKQSIISRLQRPQLSNDHYWYIFWNSLWYRYSGVLSGTHPMATGLWRTKDRTDRRRGMPRESLMRFAWRRMVDGYREARIYLTLFREFHEIWLLTRRRKDPKWAPMTDLRLRWAALQQLMIESRWTGRIDEAVREGRAVLQTAADRLAEMSRRSREIGGTQAERLGKAAADLQAYLASNDWKPDLNVLAGARQFLAEKVIAPCEEIAYRPVKIRRRLNSWWSRVASRFQQRKLFSLSYLLSPFVFAWEMLFGLRFAVKAMRRQEM